MMVNLIDQDAAIAIAERYGCANGSSLGRHSGVADCIAYELTTLPIVNAEPVKRGSWKAKQIKYGKDGWPIEEWQSMQCSECKKYLTTPYLYNLDEYNYCPHCGCRMEVNE